MPLFPPSDPIKTYPSFTPPAIPSGGGGFLAPPDPRLKLTPEQMAKMKSVQGVPAAMPNPSPSFPGRFPSQGLPQMLPSQMGQSMPMIQFSGDMNSYENWKKKKELEQLALQKMMMQQFSNSPMLASRMSGYSPFQMY